MLSIFGCLGFSLTFAVIQKPCEGSFRDPARVGFAFLKQIVIFLKSPKWQHKLVREYKRGKLILYFLNNAAKAFKWAKNLREHSLREKCPNTKLHLVRIFLHSD